DTVVQVLFVRRGRLIGRDSFVLQGADLAATPAENGDEPSPVDESGRQTLGDLIGAFIQRYYAEAPSVPPRLLVQYMPSQRDLLAEWLRRKRGGKVELRMPQRGKKRKLMAMAAQNAAEQLRVQQSEWAADAHRQTQALAELQDALGLSKPPARIECYDISTLQGTNTVGSMVVFARGAPLKSAYKRFKIRGRGGQGEPDDFASMREVLRRRFRRAVESQQADPGARSRKSDEQWKILPDLVIVDGGKGQLGVAVEVLKEFDLLEIVPVVGLAKREEEIFAPGRSRPIWLKRGSPALHLVQRIRDEAHRFAITYHRNLRSKRQIRSKLDDVPGIGPARRKALLQFFGGDIERIRQASLEELLAVPGMNRRAAQALKEHL
ncbi:MAG: excinuclease ABC subunit UvrC, partial [Caldilineae bacterium]